VFVVPRSNIKIHVKYCHSRNPERLPLYGWSISTTRLYTRGSQRDVVYLGWPITPSYMSPNEGGMRFFSQWVQWSPNKLCRPNSIFYIQYAIYECLSDVKFSKTSALERTKALVLFQNLIVKSRPSWCVLPHRCFGVYIFISPRSVSNRVCDMQRQYW
jgi:hypothetical protein